MTIRDWLHLKPTKIETLKGEIEEAKRSVDATAPIVEEAAKRRSDAAEAARHEATKVQIECVLLRDILEGLGEDDVK